MVKVEFFSDTNLSGFWEAVTSLAPEISEMSELDVEESAVLLDDQVYEDYESAIDDMVVDYGGEVCN